MSNTHVADSAYFDGEAYPSGQEEHDPSSDD